MPTTLPEKADATTAFHRRDGRGHDDEGEQSDQDQDKQEAHGESSAMPVHWRGRGWAIYPPAPPAVTEEAGIGSTV